MKTIEQLKELAGTVEGDLWKPRLETAYNAHQGSVVAPGVGAKGWYWRDTAENPTDQWRGPFKSERAAWINALAQYGVEPEDKTEHEMLLDALEACVRAYLGVDVEHGIHGPAHAAFNLLREQGRDLTGKI